MTYDTSMFLFFFLQYGYLVGHVQILVLMSNLLFDPAE